ncbi:NmrA/HSCARG family protein [Trinickia terrae]|uniref:NmrA/HSCARG family protein n=1 Tax=Trinickia terrae TaxID=2571161 RepID=A0A4U1HD68_9BURK|nr:NmrA/HSCARG family protein [Trinickia terrae]TKC78822.1 NmrA/HSCARG family protein [Trinickia terrae]
MSSTQKLIAVVGASGQQGGAVVRALRAGGQFKVRALTRNPATHPELGDEVVLADFNRPETLEAAFAGAHGVFLVTNSWEAGADEPKQALAAVDAAKDAGVQHFIWSTLPNVETISGGKINVPHFTEKAKIERIVSEAGFACHTFVIAPFYYQNLLGVMAPQKQADGTAGWALPLDPERRVIHMGDITELGRIVAGAFAQPELAGHGEHLPLVGDFLSFNEIIATLNRQGNRFSFKQVPREVFAGWFPGAEGIAAMLAYFEAHTYLGSDSPDLRDAAIALAGKVAGQQPTNFAVWAKANFVTLESAP